MYLSQSLRSAMSLLGDFFAGAAPAIGTDVSVLPVAGGCLKASLRRASFFR